MEVPKINLKQRLSIFRIDQDRQRKVYQEIRDNAKPDFDFFVLLILSTIIIALGLFINSPAVVIGGMIIAPLVWPILALALSIVKGQSGLLGRSMFTVLKSTLIILLISILVGLITPEVAVESQEIFTRTQPQLYELFIALASGFVAAFVISYPKLGGAMAGVVMAAALVPPLAAMGLLIAQNDLTAASGAFLLYISNLIAITLASSAMFFLVRFRGPVTAEAQEAQKSNLRWSFVFLLVIIIPLILITADSIRLENQKSVVEDVLLAKIDAIEVQSINISDSGELLVVEVVAQSTHNVYTYQVEELTEILSHELEKSVLLQISVIPVIEAGKINSPERDDFLNLKEGLDEISKQ